MKIKLDELEESINIAVEETNKTIPSAIEHEDIHAAIAWVKKTVVATADEASKLGDELAESIKFAAEETSKTLSSAIEHEDSQATLAWVRKTVVATADEASKLGKAAVQSDMAKDAAAGAAVGAAIAIPVPLIGPIGGAAIGAAFGVYKNITKSNKGTLEVSVPKSDIDQPTKKALDTHDVYDQLVKFDDLRKQGIITDDEFEQQKKRLLGLN